MKNNNNIFRLLLYAFMLIWFGQSINCLNAQSALINKAEYFYDIDPGKGNGIDIPVIADSIIDKNIALDISGLTEGLHKVYFRVMDENNLWGQTNSMTIIVEEEPAPVSPLSNLILAEYFFDTDPGEGNETIISISADSIIDESLYLDVSGLTSGTHKVYFRVLDENNIWSQTNSMTIVVEEDLEPLSPAPNLIAAEYFFDTDPGEGNGMSIPITTDSIIDESFALDVSGLISGSHKVYLRVLDVNNKWSHANAMNIYVVDDPSPLPPSPNIISSEYFFDTDPGEGNGISLPVLADSIVDETFTLDISGLTSGIHKVYFRVLDENNKWSHTNTSSIFVENYQPYSPQPLPNIVGLEYYFGDDPGMGNANTVAISSDSIVEESFGDVTSGFEIGEQLIFFRITDENRLWSHTNYSDFYLVELKAFLEGPFNPTTGEMETNLNDNGYLPLQQPFNTNPLADWYYTGMENVISIPNPDVVDWVLLQVRDTSDAAFATESTIKETRAAFLLKDGSIVELDGVTPVSFTQPNNYNIYIVLFHRNHLGVIASSAIAQTDIGAYTYDFSSSQSQVYGDSLAHKEIDTGVWGMKGGDGFGDGTIDNKDKNDTWYEYLGLSGYNSGDFDMSGTVEQTDKDEIWDENAAQGSRIPE